MGTALLSSLREEVEVWKTKFQEQVAASATAAVPNGESGDSAELEKALQDTAQAQEEASRWKEKAVAAQELEGAFVSVPFFCCIFYFPSGDKWAAAVCTQPVEKVSRDCCRLTTPTCVHLSRKTCF